MALGTRRSLYAQISYAHQRLARILDSVWFWIVSLLSKLSAPFKKSGKSVHPNDTPKPKTGNGPPPTAGMLISESPVDSKEPDKYGGKKIPLWEKAAVLIALGVLVVNFFQLRAQTSAMETDERAWITAKLILAQNGGIELVLTNTGKTPARSVHEVLEGPQIAPSNIVPEPMNFTYGPDIRRGLIEPFKKALSNIPEDRTGFVIAPGEPTKVTKYVPTIVLINQQIPLGQREYFQGRITYIDIFDRPCETAYCYWYSSPDFFMCDNHNWMN